MLRRCPYEPFLSLVPWLERAFQFSGPDSVGCIIWPIPWSSLDWLYKYWTGSTNTSCCSTLKAAFKLFICCQGEEGWSCVVCVLIKSFPLFGYVLLLWEHDSEDVIVVHTYIEIYILWSVSDRAKAGLGRYTCRSGALPVVRSPCSVAG